MLRLGLNPTALFSSACKQLGRNFLQLQPVRGYRETPDSTWRHYGFDQHVNWHVGGPLPRNKVTHETRPVPRRQHRHVNRWSANKAAAGQNDYIDILGDGTLHPRDLLKGPNWLRGFRGTEMQRLIRQREYSLDWMPNILPSKWNDLEKRLRYLEKYHNQKQNHKDWRNRARFEKRAHRWDV